MTPKILKLEKEQDALFEECRDRKSRGLNTDALGCYLLRNQMALRRERAKLAVKNYDPTTQVLLEGYRSIKYGPLIPTIWDRGRVIKNYDNLSDRAKKHLEGKI